jgi:DNA-binding Lrp family transcriptional regulator
MEKHKGIFLELDYGQNVHLDLKDKKILSILGENCRIPVTTIGKIIHSSKGSVSYRIQELMKKEIYRKNIAVINPFIFGFPVRVVLIKLKNISTEKENEIIQFFENNPFVIWFGETQGSYDFNISMTATNLNHFNKMISEIKRKIGRDLKELKILKLTKFYNCETIPVKMKKELNISFPEMKRDYSFNSLLKKPYSSADEIIEKPKLKEILILSEIANNANISLQAISEKTGIKRDSVKNIISSLIQRNIILAFRGVINLSFLRLHGYVSYFKINSKAKKGRVSELEHYFRGSEYTAFGAMAEDSYYTFLTYHSAGNPLEFNALIKDIRNKFSDIIEEYTADLILKDYKLTFFPEGLLSPIKSLIVKVGAKLGF